MSEFSGPSGIYDENADNVIVCDCTSNNVHLIMGWSGGRGWSGGAMVLGKLPVPGRPANLDYSRTRAYCSCSGCGWGLFGHFFSRLSFLFSFSLSLGEGVVGWCDGAG